MTEKRHEYCYARVSTTGQDPLNQKPELDKWKDVHAPDAEYLQDIGSGKDMKRPSMERIIAAIKRGACKSVTVVSVERLGRSLMDIAHVIDLAIKNKTNLIFLRQGFDIMTPTGKMMAYVFAMIGQMQWELMSEHTKAGLAKSKAASEARGEKWKTGGNVPGWSSKMTPVKAKQIHFLFNEGYNYAQVAREVGVSAATVKKCIHEPNKEYITRAELNKRIADATKGKKKK